MNPLHPVVPSLLIGGASYILRERARWWWVPVLIFLFSFGYQLNLLLPRIYPDLPNIPGVEVEVSIGITDFLPTILLVSLYFSLLSVVFTLVGLGINTFLGKWLTADAPRYVVATYITLLLLQLWVEVFPWTLAMPLELYSSLP